MNTFIKYFRKYLWSPIGIISLFCLVLIIPTIIFTPKIDECIDACAKQGFESYSIRDNDCYCNLDKPIPKPISPHLKLIRLK